MAPTVLSPPLVAVPSPVARVSGAIPTGTARSGTARSGTARPATAPTDAAGTVPVRALPVRSVDGLLASARSGLAEAASAVTPAERYAAAHLAALRAAAAVLAARARPLTGRPGRRVRRPTSAWALLAGVAPELGEWAAFFAAGAGKRAAAEAGLRSAATSREADDLLRDAEAFLALVEHLLGRLPEPPRTGRSASGP